jgi:gamma-glutamyl-gamma-aminobutyrate hydrolase PuuD
VAADGVVKAVRHSAHPITGIMWHPERIAPFAADDVALFRRVFGAA